MSHVPVLDLEDDPARLARSLDDVCAHVGFFQVVGHGVSDSSDRAWAAMQEFFALPLEQKQALLPPLPGYPHGYSPVAAEALSRSRGVDSPPDLKEVLNTGPVDPPRHDVSAEEQIVWSPNLWPSLLPELRESWTVHHRAMQALSDRLMGLFALALSLPETYFDRYVDRAACGLRGICYPARSDAPEQGQLRAGAHTDYGTLTLLRQDTTGGLEVATTDGRWAPVDPVPDAFVVNIGDLLAGWTNDRWRSTLHRVTDPPTAPTGRRATRYSMPFFHNANWDAVIECLPTCVRAGERPHYEPLVAGPHLRQKYQRSIALTL